MRPFYLFYAFLCATLFCFPLIAQSSFIIEQIGLEEGLSHRWVNQIIQDRNGYLWVATADGLNRYDGHEFKTYPALEKDYDVQRVISIQEAADSTIWIKDFEQPDQVVQLNPDTGESRVLDEKNDIFVPLKATQQTIYKSFAEELSELRGYFDKDNTKKEALYRRSNAPRPLLFGLKSRGTETAITRKEGEAIWIWYNWQEKSKADRKGRPNYARFDIREKTWNRFLIADFLGVKIVHPTLPIDHKGRFWYPSFENGLDQPFTFFQMPPDIPLQDWETIRVDNRQNIWIYGDRSGLYRFDIRQHQLEFITLIGRYRFEVYEDQEGTFWLGTENGLLKIRRRKQLFKQYLNKTFDLGTAPPIGNSVYFTTELDNGKILTSSNVHWQVLDPSTRDQFPLEFSFHPDLIYKVADNLYLLHRDDRFMKLDLRDFYLQQIEVPKELNAYLGTSAHKIPLLLKREDKLLVMYDTLTHTFEWSGTPLQGSSLSFPFWDRQRQLLWSNSGQGVRKIDLQDLSETHFQLLDYTSNQYIRAWIPQGDSIWLATSDGLQLMDIHTGHIHRRFTTEEGLPDNLIYSAIATQEHFWLGTSNGLCRFNRKTFETRNFFVEDGLSHHEFNSTAAIQTRDGKIWMGGLNGYNVFDPKILGQKPNQAAKLYLSKFSKYNKKIDSVIVKDHITAQQHPTIKVYPNESILSFRFFLNSLIQPEKHHYLWYLEGQEPAWSNVSQQPIAEYQYLPPGNYTLKVKALDATGHSGGNELNIAIKVIEVWYKRWWAISLYLLLFGSLVFAFYRFQINRKLSQQEALKLKELDAVKSRLYTNITHEFRTPLTVILGTAAQLTDKRKTLAAGAAEQEELEIELRAVRRNGEHLLNLINQMLDLSKLEAGKLTLQLVQADIIGYANYILSSFHSYASAKDIDLCFQSEMSTFVMDYDRDKMLNIVSNLLSNAIKFTPDGGKVVLQVKSERVKSEGNDARTTSHQPPADFGLLRLRSGKAHSAFSLFQSFTGFAPSPFTTHSSLIIQIQDTGIGIPADQLSSIFDRFYQVDDPKGTHLLNRGAGTGIGLTFVKELVKMMNGEILVESILDKGTTFTVSLPVTNEAPLASPEMEPWSIAEPANLDRPALPVSVTHDQQQPLLLVVEDNLDVAHYIQSCLEKDYQTIFAPNGQTGIDMAIETIPDIIISDVMMPQKNGFELLQTLKQDERTSHIPIILLTAKADIDSRIEGLEYGADAYLAKPFHQKELEVRLEKLIEIRRKLQEKYSGGKPEEKPSNIEDAFLQKVNGVILKHIADDQFSGAGLARKTHLSESQLYRKLKALTGKSTAIYIRSIRLNKGMELLKTTNMNVSEVAYEVGFTNLSYFSRVFSREFGVSPNEYRN